MLAAKFGEGRLRSLPSNSDQKSAYLEGQSGGTANACPVNLYQHSGGSREKIAGFVFVWMSSSTLMV